MLTFLTFELAQRDGGAACRLAFSVILDSVDKAARDAAGWDDCLDMLDEVVSGETPQRPSATDRWEGYYAEYKRRGLPATAEIPQCRNASVGLCHGAILAEVLNPYRL
jgi:hypothetical protein